MFDAAEQLVHEGEEEPETRHRPEVEVFAPASTPVVTVAYNILLFALKAVSAIDASGRVTEPDPESITMLPVELPPKVSVCILVD